jgi:hypothetical protein
VISQPTRPSNPKRGSKLAKRHQQPESARQIKRPDRDTPKPIRFDPDDFEACCRLIEWEIKGRHPAAAHAALDRFIASCDLAEDVLTLDAPVQVLQSVFGDVVGPTQRDINQLESAGFLTVLAFVQATREDFRVIPNIGLLTTEKFVGLQSLIRQRISESAVAS